MERLHIGGKTLLNLAKGLNLAERVSVEEINIFKINDDYGDTGDLYISRSAVLMHC